MRDVIVRQCCLATYTRWKKGQEDFGWSRVYKSRAHAISEACGARGFVTVYRFNFPSRSRASHCSGRHFTTQLLHFTQKCTMSRPPWTLTSVKRRAKSSTPGPRKRQRRDGPESKSSDPRSKSQQTLTQARWVTPVSNGYDEPDMNVLPSERGRSTPTARSRRTLSKRNSTLTQMDFFSFPPPDDADLDDAMLAPVADSSHPPPLPQLDGAYESPRKPRKRKATPTAAGPASKRKVAIQNPESQEYKPTMKKKKRKDGNHAGEQSGTPRRTSNRLALKNEVFSDPVTNFDYFEEALNEPPRREETRDQQESRTHPSEIKDSVKDDEEIVPGPRSILDCPRLPQTPRKTPYIVLSSQSPESLPPSTQKTARKAYELPEMSQRTPLAERSGNVPVEAFTRKAFSKSSPNQEQQSPKRKITALKVSKRMQARYNTCIGDSQANVWSIPLSSSPELVRPLENASLPEPVPRCPPKNDLEIPASSQAQEVESTPAQSGTEESLPSLSEILSCRRAEDPEAGDSEVPSSSPALVGDGTGHTPIVRDFANRSGHPAAYNGSSDQKGPHSITRAESRQDHALAACDSVENTHDENSNESEDDLLGSPVPNDTQFNIQVEHRVSSPVHSRCSPGAPEPVTNIVRLPTLSPSPSRGSGLQGLGSRQVINERALSPGSSLPVPRLVQQPIADLNQEVTRLQQADSYKSEVSLPKTNIAAARGGVSTTMIPLNDTHNQSSPPSSNKAVTQKSIHPASLPHPSQMSTQEATQGFLPPSSFPPQQGEDSLEDRDDKITIKDSSSARVPMSQLPLYQRDTQSQLDIDLGLDAELDSGDEEDLDLDPPSLPSQAAGRFVDEEETELTPRGSHANVLQKRGAIVKPEKETENHGFPRSCRQGSQPEFEAEDLTIDLSQSISIPSSPNPPPLQRQYSPIPGFNNETQSNFTQNGHVTAAYIHRQHEEGILPKWFIPTPYQVPGYTRRK